MSHHPTCAERIESEKRERMSAVRAAVRAALGEDLTDKDREALADYGWNEDQPARDFADWEFTDSLILGVDIPDVDASPYVRLQMSTGGPGDEFRAYFDEFGKVYRWTYVYLDWWDCAESDLEEDDEDDVSTLFCDLVDWRISEALGLDD